MLVYLAIVVILLYLYYCKTTVVRFYKPSCRYCVESQKEWDEFKKIARNLNIVVVVDVNTEEDNEHTRYWTSRYTVNTVPHVLKIKWFGFSETYDGPRDRVDYVKFATK